MCLNSAVAQMFVQSLQGVFLQITRLKDDVEKSLQSTNTETRPYVDMVTDSLMTLSFH